MSYRTDQLEMIQRGYESTSHELEALQRDLAIHFYSLLSHEQAKEYLRQGVCRRLKVLHRTLKNIFSIFPADRIHRLNDTEVTEIQINLHAFMINIHGFMDNLAWVFVLEKSLLGSIGHRRNVGFFKEKTQRHLPASFRDYIFSLETWHNNYSNNYRDALAHRIPLYVPPAQMDDTEARQYNELQTRWNTAIAVGNYDLALHISLEQEALGRACPMFKHSFTDSDATDAVYLHPQLIADSKTAIEVATKFHAAFNATL